MFGTNPHLAGSYLRCYVQVIPELEKLVFIAGQVCATPTKGEE